MKAYLKNRHPQIYGNCSNFAKWLSKCIFSLIYKSPRWWAVIKAVLIGFPAMVLSLATLKLPTVPGQATLLGWIGQTPWVIPIIVGWPILMQMGLSFVEWGFDYQKAEQEMDRKRFTALYTAIEELVGKKLNHIASVAHEIRRGLGPRTKQEALSRLIQSDDHIEHLAEGIYDVVNYTVGVTRGSNDTIKIVLAEVDKGTVSRFRVHLPSNNTPNSAMLGPGNVRKTLWAKALQSKKTHLIEDIEFHLSDEGPAEKLYIKSTETSNDRGSIAAIPIIHPQTSNVIFVLSLKTSKPFMICDDLLKTLKPAIDAFTSRLLLEHNLEFIQKNTS